MESVFVDRVPNLAPSTNPTLSDSIPVPNIGGADPIISDSDKILLDDSQQDRAAAAPVQQPTANVDVPVSVNLTAQPVSIAAPVPEISQSKPSSRKPKKLNAKRRARVKAAKLAAKDAVNEPSPPVQPVPKTAAPIQYTLPPATLG